MYLGSDALMALLELERTSTPTTATATSCSTSRSRSRRARSSCLLGRNGAGKTTTVRSIMGLTPPRAGRITLQRQDLVGLPPFRIARLGIGFVPEDRRMFPNLTVRENLEVARADLGQRRRPAGRPSGSSSCSPILRERRRQAGGTLSGGEQQMLTIARTLMGNPELLLLDEPSEGLAPLVVETLRQQLGRLKASGLTIVLAEQNVRFVSGAGRPRLHPGEGHGALPGLDGRSSSPRRCGRRTWRCSGRSPWERPRLV